MKNSLKIWAALLAAVMLISGCGKNVNDNGQTDPDPVEQNDDKGPIKISEPIKNSEISFPLAIKGEAPGNWFFEAVFTADLIDSESNVLGTAILTAQGDWMQEGPVAFSGEIGSILAPRSSSKELSLVFKKANASGLPEHDESYEIPLKFTNSQVVKIYFPKGEAGTDCSLVEEVERLVSAEFNPGESAIVEVLNGPSAAEIEAGYYTSINPGSLLQSFKIEDGVATADFNLAFNDVAGSCRVESIRSQIEKTLMAIEGVESVVISVNGETETVLQP